MIRSNKEYKLNVCRNMVLKYGTTNKFNPKVIYITARLWLCPTFNGDYNQSISHIHNRFKKNIKNTLYKSELFNNDFILDFDIKPDNLENGKKKFFQIYLFIKQEGEEVKDIKDIYGIIADYFGSIFADFEDDMYENEFLLSKTKN